jgi:hypothetical protein
MITDPRSCRFAITNQANTATPQAVPMSRGGPAIGPRPGFATIGFDRTALRNLYDKLGANVVRPTLEGHTQHADGHVGEVESLFEAADQVQQNVSGSRINSAISAPCPRNAGAAVGRG